MIRLTSVCLASVLTALPLLAQSRIVASATTPAETVSWSSGVSYTYDGSGNMRQIGKDRFAYDKVGRLAQAEVNGVTRVYTYDAFGNRTGCTHGPGTTELSDCQFGQSTDSSTNRVKNLNYDDGGNLRAYQGHTYTYDVLNMPVRDDSGSGFAKEFIYTADDERIATHAVGSSWSWTVRGLDGKVLREFTSNAQGGFAWARDYVYRDGLLLASVRPSGLGAVREHYHLDHLGTPRRVTNQNNRTVGFHDYYAFGPEVSGGLTEPAPTALQYTGHERDKWLTDGPDTLDYMHARYYSPALGRFFSVDPSRGQAASPQSLNRYAYALNNPLRFFDPTGTTFRLYNWMNDAAEQALYAELRSQTGLTLSATANSAGVLELTYAKDSNGKPLISTDSNGTKLGSPTARADLIAAIDSTTKMFTVNRQDNDPSFNMGIANVGANGAYIRLDFADMAQINTGNNPSNTFNSGWVFIHEALGHGFKRFHDPVQGMLAQHPTLTGKTVDYENKIRKELGITSRRSQYRTETDKQGRHYIPFTNGPVYIP